MKTGTLDFLCKLEYYCNLPYTIVVKEESDGSFFACIKELKGCMTCGSTKEDALRMLIDAKEAWLSVAIEDDEKIPRPEGDLNDIY